LKIEVAIEIEVKSANYIFFIG